MKERFIVANRIELPNGVILHSKRRHDYVAAEYNGKYYAVDGGNDYKRYVFDVQDFKDVSVYSDDSFEEIREALHRGGRGINGDEPLKYVLLKDMSDNWLKNVIEYEQSNRPDNKYLPFYIAEIKYRKEHNIKIDE